MPKKTTRDVPLPSSDGLFGGPGDPKKKYTASDSVDFHKNFLPTRKQLKREMQSDWELATRPPGHPLFGAGTEKFVRSSHKFKQYEAQGRRNPYASTYTKRTGDAINTTIRDIPSTRKKRNELFPKKKK
jgi:hypothetical protein